MYLFLSNQFYVPDTQSKGRTWWIWRKGRDWLKIFPFPPATTYWFRAATKNNATFRHSAPYPPSSDKKQMLETNLFLEIDFLIVKKKVFSLPCWLALPSCNFLLFDGGNYFLQSFLLFKGKSLSLLSWDYLKWSGLKCLFPWIKDAVIGASMLLVLISKGFFFVSKNPMLLQEALFMCVIMCAREIALNYLSIYNLFCMLIIMQDK